METDPEFGAFVPSEYFLGHAAAIGALLHEIFDAMALTDDQTRAMRDKLLDIHEALPESTANVPHKDMVNHFAHHQLESFFRVRLLDR